MRIYFDREKETLINSAGDQNAVTSLTFRRTSASPLIVQVASAGKIVDLGTPEIYFVLKTDGKYDATALLLTGAFTKSGSGTAAEWSTTLNLITTELDALFAVDEDVDNDVAQITLMGELAIVDGGTLRQTGKLVVNILNNVYRDDEDPVEETVAPGTYLTTAGNNRVRPELAITDLTELRAYATLGLPLPHLIAVSIADQPTFWSVEAGTAADNGTTIIRPDDYATSTNEVNLVARTPPVLPVASRQSVKSFQAATATSAITTPDNAAADLGLGDFSFAFKLKAPTSQNLEQYLYEKWNTYGVSLSINSGNELKLFLGESGDPQLTVASGVNDGLWHNYVIACDRSGNAVCYIDGVAQAAVDVTAFSALNLDNTVTAGIYGKDVSSSRSMTQCYASDYFILTKDLITQSEAVSLAIDAEYWRTMDNVAFAVGVQSAGVVVDHGPNSLPVTVRGSFEYFGYEQPTTTAPASASDKGTPGQVAYDGSYIYVCTATDTWLRAAIATWA